jgi:hypothetical protein
MVDTTFGSFPAAKTLISILIKTDSKRITNKVGAAISDFRETLKELENIKEPRIKKRLSQMWKEESKKIIEALKLPDEVNRFTLNVISSIYKENLKNDKR